MIINEEIRQQEFQDGFIVGRNDAILEVKKMIEGAKIRWVFINNESTDKISHKEGECSYCDGLRLFNNLIKQLQELKTKSDNDLIEETTNNMKNELKEKSNII